MATHIVTRIRALQHHLMLMFGLASLSLLTGVVAAVPTVDAQEGLVQTQAANLHASGDASIELPGAGTLKSSANDVWVTVHASELDPHTVYTLWAVVFNNPSECTTDSASLTRCGLPDLMAIPNPAEASAFIVGGLLTGDDGIANIQAHIQSGPLPEGTAVLTGVGGANDNGVVPGLREGNGLLAEIHFVLRTHGSAIVGRVAEQISMGNGGCPPNECANQQSVMFPPAMN